MNNTRFRNTPSTTNLEEEEIVDAPGNDGNASMPEQFKRPNQWSKMMMMMMKMKFAENIIGIPNTNNEARDLMYIPILPAPPLSVM